MNPSAPPPAWVAHSKPKTGRAPNLAPATRRRFRRRLALRLKHNSTVPHTNAAPLAAFEWGFSLAVTERWPTNSFPRSFSLPRALTRRPARPAFHQLMARPRIEIEPVKFLQLPNPRQ